MERRVFEETSPKKNENQYSNRFSFSFKLDVGSVLSSQAVAHQVLSPLQGFTTVFGMGTGGLPAIGHQQTCRLLISFYSRPQLYAEDCIRLVININSFPYLVPVQSKIAPFVSLALHSQRH